MDDLKMTVQADQGAPQRLKHTADACHDGASELRGNFRRILHRHKDA
jgi:hypothetical protein